MSLLTDQSIELNLLLEHEIISEDQHKIIHRDLDGKQSIMPILINQHGINNAKITELFRNKFNFEPIAITSNLFYEIDPRSFRDPLGKTHHGIMLSNGSDIKIVASCMSDLNSIKSSVMHQFKVTCYLTDYESICKIINAWQSHHVYASYQITNNL